MLKKNLSFHPRLGAVLDLVFGLVFWWWIREINAPFVLVVWIIFRVVLWVILIWLVSYVEGLKRWQHFCSLLLLLTGTVSFLLFIEWPLVWNLVGFSTAFFSAISFWLLPAKAGQPLFVFKPYRRWRLFMSTFGLLGMWSAGYALATLRIFSFNILYFVFFSTLVSTAVAVWWLKEYGVSTSKNFWFWVLAIVLIILELSAVLFLWPIGYFVSGFLLVWFWYIIWIMARFHLSTAGINWKKQIYFFVGNGIFIFIFLLLIARWR